MHNAEELQQFFNNELHKLHFNREPGNLYKPFDYVLGLSGKRIRPVMLMMACEMFGSDASVTISQAIAIELFHNFTLIHDDIMDHAPLRRGMPSVHEKFDQTVAILSGDAMLVYAYQFLIQTKFSPVEKLISIFNECAIKVCEGQQMDMNFEITNDVTVDDYLQMIELKTATLIATSLKIGALVSGASDTDANHLYEFGKDLGIAFQLNDDWLDAFGDANKTGKQAGGDIIQNKKTYLLLKAMQIADPATKKELINYLSSMENDTERKVKATVEIFQQLGVDLIAKKTRDTHYHDALVSLEKVSANDIQKLQLKNITATMMYR